MPSELTPPLMAGSVDDAESCLDHARTHIQAQRWDAAGKACAQALALMPDHPEAHHLAALVSGQAGEYEQAIAAMQHAVALAPQHAQCHYNLAVCLQQMGRDSEAATHYQACLRLQPEHANALWNYAEILRLAGYFDHAAERLERFAAMGGNYPTLQHRLAVCYSALQRDAEAEVAFLDELKGDAPNPLTHWEYALFLLSRERFAEGFAHYRQRFHCGGNNGVYCHAFALPAWLGSFGRGGSLLVHGEQGLGDSMMFASVLPQLLAEAAQSNSRVILAVQPALVRLFSHSFPQAIVRAHRVGGPVADLAGLGPIDWQLPMGDLLALYRQRAADFDAGRHTYLHADATRSAWYAQRLAAMLPHDGRKRLRVGLMWGSNPAPVSAQFMRWTRQRSIPAEQFEALAGLVPSVRFISLHNAERGAEASLAPSLDILDLSAEQGDFFETAALIDNLDLVISVDTSVSHLAGAMGKPVWVPLMRRCDWRFGLTRDKSYWYPHMRHFRQSTEGDWAAVLTALEQALREHPGA